MRKYLFLALVALALSAPTSFAGLKHLKGTFLFNADLYNVFVSDGGYAFRGAVKIDRKGKIKGVARVMQPFPAAPAPMLPDYDARLSGKARGVGKKFVSIKIRSSDGATFTATYKKLGSSYYPEKSKSKLGSYNSSEEFLFEN